MNNDYVGFFRPVRTATIVLLVAGAVFLVAGTVSAIRTWSIPVASTAEISVLGQGEVFAVPDIATFSFTVQEEGSNVKEAQDKATAKTNAAIDYLKQAQIAEKDIKTTSYNANPKYEYQQASCTTYRCPPGKQVLVGYEVSQTIQVKVRDTAKAGTILAGVGGLNVQYVSGLQFTIDDEDAIKGQAREKAIANAKTKAQALAKNLGVRLVRVVSFGEDQGNYPYYGSFDAGAMGKGAAMAPTPNIPSGENKYSVNVTVTYEIR